MRTHQPSGLAPASPATHRRNLSSNKCASLAALLLAIPLAATAQLASAPAAASPTPALLVPSGLLVNVNASGAGSATESPAPAAGPAVSSSSSTDISSAAADEPASPDPDAPAPAPKLRKHTPESEIAVEGFYSYGNWQIFAAGDDESLWTAGFEYDRHSWGEFVGAQMDYVAEVLPFVLLRQPHYLNAYGVRQGPKQDVDYLHGFAFSPIGLRMEWRHNKAFKPYFNVKGGAIGFTQKALSPDASYYDFSLQESIGFYLRMSQRLDMRFGLFGDYHFSNAYITSFNPGLDVMNSNLALSYHFGSDQPQR